MYTRILPAIFHLREVITFGINMIRFLENISRTELDTYLASLASFRDDVNLAFGNNLLLNIDRDT